MLALVIVCCLLQGILNFQEGLGDVICPRACNCSRFPLVECANRGLLTVPQDLPDNVTHLDLNGNSISNLGTFSQVSADLRSLTVLNLDNNDVTTLRQSSFESLPRLKELYLRNNKLSVIEQSSTVFSSMSILRLGGNPFRCDCHLLGFRRWLETARNNIDIDTVEIHCSWPAGGVQVLAFQQDVFVCDINECSQIDRGGCQHRCVNNYGSYTCQCSLGYNLQSDGKTCVDINECLGSSRGCTSGCMNLEGSFVCLCPDGLVLGGDKRSCVIADSRACPPEVTSDSKGTFPWQQTTVGTLSHVACPVGFQSDSSMPSTLVVNATRRCDVGAQWSSPDTSQCHYLSDTTRSLVTYTKEKIDSGNRNQLAALVNSAVGDATSLSGDDVNFATTLLDRILNANLGAIAEQVGQDVIGAVSKLMASARTSLDSGQMKFRTSTRLIELVEAYGDMVSLPFGISSGTTHADNLIVRVVDANPSNFDGALLVAVTPTSVGGGNTFDVISRHGRTPLLETVGDRLLAGIRIPSGLLNELGITASPERVQLVLYTSSALFQSSVNSSVILNPGWVVGARIKSLSTVANLMQEVEVVIRHRELSADETAVCAYWDPSANNRRGSWSTDGCRLDVQTSTSSVSACKCNHLTNFAVLVASSCVNGTDCDRKIHLEVYIGCGVSLLFVCILFILMSLVRKQRTSTSMSIQKNFAVTQVLILVPFLAGIFRTSSDGVCQAIAAVLHFGLLSAIMWLATETITFYIELTRMLGIQRNPNITKRFFLAWGLPLAVVIVLIVVGNTTDTNIYGGTEYCWIQHDITLITTFYVPFGLLVVMNIVFYFLIHYRLGKQPLPALLLRLRSDAVTLLLLVISVGFGALVVVGVAGDHLALRVLFIVFCVLHTGAMFLLQCLVNVQVRHKISNVLFTNKRMLSYSRSTSHTTLESRYSDRDRSHAPSLVGRDPRWKHSPYHPHTAGDIEDYYYRDIDKRTMHSRLPASGEFGRQEVYLSADGKAFYKPKMYQGRTVRQGEGRYFGESMEDVDWQDNPWWTNAGVYDDVSGRSARKSPGYSLERTIDKQQTMALEDWPTPQFV